LRCKCSEGYCFVCQEGGLSDHSPHWGPGKCPKCGQPA
jgi:predicted ATP-dependent serine protease